VLLLLAVFAFAFGLAQPVPHSLCGRRHLSGVLLAARDPLGTKAFYKSLAALLPTRRNFQPVSKLAEGKDTTLLYLGARPADLEFTASEFALLETFSHTGGRFGDRALPELPASAHQPLAAPGTPAPGRPSPQKQSPPGATTNSPTLPPHSQSRNGGGSSSVICRVAPRSGGGLQTGPGDP